MSGTIDHVNLTVSIDSQLLNALDVRSASDRVQMLDNYLLSNGTSSGNASQQWCDTRTIAASGSDTLDLAAVLTNAFGVTLTFATIKLIYVKASSANTNNVNFSRATSNGVPFFLAATDGVAIKPGGCFLLFDPVGYTVTAATGDIITVANSSSGTGVDYTILIVGTD